MDKEKIKRGIITTSMVFPSTKIFLSVMGWEELQEEKYYFGFIDLSSDRMFGIEALSDPEDAISKFVNTVFAFRGNGQGARA